MVCLSVEAYLERSRLIDNNLLQKEKDISYLKEFAETNRYFYLQFLVYKATELHSLLNNPMASNQRFSIHLSKASPLECSQKASKNKRDLLGGKQIKLFLQLYFFVQIFSYLNFQILNMIFAL